MRMLGGVGDKIKTIRPPNDPTSETSSARLGLPQYQVVKTYERAYL